MKAVVFTRYGSPDVLQLKEIATPAPEDGVGTFAVQIARLSGAEVTGVDSGEKLDLLRSLGAERWRVSPRRCFSGRGSG